MVSRSGVGGTGVSATGLWVMGDGPGAILPVTLVRPAQCRCDTTRLIVYHASAFLHSDYADCAGHSAHSSSAGAGSRVGISPSNHGLWGGFPCAVENISRIDTFVLENPPQRKYTYPSRRSHQQSLSGLIRGAGIGVATSRYPRGAGIGGRWYRSGHQPVSQRRWYRRAPVSGGRIGAVASKRLHQRSRRYGW